MTLSLRLRASGSRRQRCAQVFDCGVPVGIQASEQVQNWREDGVRVVSTSLTHKPLQTGITYRSCIERGQGGLAFLPLIIGDLATRVERLPSAKGEIYKETNLVSASSLHSEQLEEPESQVVCLTCAQGIFHFLFIYLF